MPVEPITAEIDRTTELIAAVKAGRYQRLFLISFAILFFELACIRWFASTVVFLTFFTNLVLMACFLGMCVGCLAASRKQDLSRMVLPTLLVAVLLSYATLAAYVFFGRIMFDVGGQGSPQEIYFGTEGRPNDPSHFVVPIEVVAGIFYVLIAIIFVGLGQIMGRALNAIPNRVGAYTTNILGSLAGILAFGLASYLRTPPYLWFAVATAICLYFVRPWSRLQLFSQPGLMLVLALSAYYEGQHVMTIWSPYYKVWYQQNTGSITTNNIGHQTMLRVAEKGPAYALPHLLNRDAGNAPFGDVLVIGAGSGNDVAAAVSHNARSVDAVEIEPVIYGIGRADHPDRPYDDPRVHIYLDDGRSFVSKTDHKYDLAIYALTDSLVLHSGYSSLRLESFLFTEQAFRDVKAHLKPNGMFVMYNFYRQGWVVARLKKMVEKVFGNEPLIIQLPYLDGVAPAQRLNGYTFVMAGSAGCAPLEAIRSRLNASGQFQLSRRPADNEPVNGYAIEAGRTDASGSPWLKIAPASVEEGPYARTPTDDWPFLYLREAAIPDLNIRNMVLIAVISLVILMTFAPVRTIRPNGQMFFLGAGFMLLETKSVVHMALLFGSTWVVNSIVFFAILVMILLSNLFVLSAKPKKVWPFYVLLLPALIVNAYVPMDFFLQLPAVYKVLASCAVVFVPIFFAGAIFATSFRDSRHPDIDFGSNIGGVILGGLSEYFSLMVGFNAVLFIAVAYYLLSAVLKPRLVSVPGTST